MRGSSPSVGSPRELGEFTLAAETLAMVDGIDLGVILATLFCEVAYGVADPQLLPIKCITDCKSLLDAIKSNKLVSEKRLRLELSAIKENLSREHVTNVKWGEANEQLANCLTKHGSSPIKLLSIFESGKLA